MRHIAVALCSVTVVACGGPHPEMLKERDLEGAYEAFRSNIAAIHRRDTEAYLAHYLESPELVVASADSLRRGFVLFAEARRASEDWPDTLIAGRPVLVWIGPGVVWGAYEYTVVQGGDTARGWSDRVFLKTGGGWKIAVTGTRKR
jgi:hypothetical protein